MKWILMAVLVLHVILANGAPVVEEKQPDPVLDCQIIINRRSPIPATEDASEEDSDSSDTEEDEADSEQTEPAEPASPAESADATFDLESLYRKIDEKKVSVSCQWRKVAGFESGSDVDHSRVRRGFGKKLRKALKKASKRVAVVASVSIPFGR